MSTRVLRATLPCVLAIGALSATTARGAGGPSASVEPMRLVSEVMETPVQTLDGDVRITRTRVTLDADVLFAFGSARLTKAAHRSIATAAEVLEQEAPKAVRVVGHTDSKGSDATNLRLSMRRAQRVAAALRRALPGGGPRLTVVGRGERDPVAANTKDGRDDPAGRARNRRVELVRR